MTTGIIIILRKGDNRGVTLLWSYKGGMVILSSDNMGDINVITFSIPMAITLCLHDLNIFSPPVSL